MMAKRRRNATTWQIPHARVHDLRRGKTENGRAQFWSPLLGRGALDTREAHQILASFNSPICPAKLYKCPSIQAAMSFDKFQDTWRELSDSGFVYRFQGLLDRPVIIVSAPRAGSTLLFETLRENPQLWTVGGESHFIIESLPQLKPEHRGFDSHRLERGDASPDICQQLIAAFISYLRDRTGRRYLDLLPSDRPTSIRLLEKTPRNALRVAFLNALVPDALFVFLHRSPRENIASIMEAWKADGFWQFKRGVPDCELPGWDRDEWCMLLPPDWQRLNGCSLEEIAAFQWRSSNESILRDLTSVVPRHRWLPITFRELVASPFQCIQRICQFSSAHFDETFEKSLKGPLLVSSSTVTPPSPKKWRRHETAVQRVISDEIAELAAHLKLLSQS